MSDPRAERKAQTHAAILRSAERLLRSRGISGASVASVMKGAGLTVGGFYAHFDSKDALVADVLHRAMIAMRAKLTDGLEDGNGRRRIAGALERYLSAAHRDHPDRGCPLPATAGDLGRESRSLRRGLADEIEGHLSTLAGAGDRDLAIGALALMVGGLTLARAVRGTPLSDEILESALRFGRRALKGPRMP